MVLIAGSQAPPICWMMIGLSGSGKSTYLRTKMPKVHVLSMDDVREEVAREYEVEYRETFASQGLSGVAHIRFEERLNKILVEQRSFAWDQTNINSGNRAPKLEKLHGEGYLVHAICFWPPESQFLLKKLVARNTHGVTLEIMQRMADEFEPPKLYEGFARRDFRNVEF